MSEKRFSIKKRIFSFKYAFRGFVHLFKEEHNSWIHAFAGIAAIIMGFVFKISLTEWIAIVFAIAIVFISELINSSIENIIDLLHPEKDPRAGKIKDLAAGAVLIASIAALIIGVLIFLPKIIN